MFFYAFYYLCFVGHNKTKVSGDTPVYVESVKAGGAAQKAGLVAGDMIVKVNIKLTFFSFFF